MLHNSAVAVLLLGIISTGIFGFLKFDTLYLTKVFAQTQQPAAVVSKSAKNLNDKAKSYNYARPRIGGPKEDFLLSNEAEVGENEIETRLHEIETTSAPQFIPAMWAHLGKINNEFGSRRNPFGGRSYEFHPGLDIDGEYGDSVIAPANGVVTKAGWQGGYGNLVEIDHGNGLITRYGHLSRIGVQIGDRIERGQLLGLIGSTGRSTGPHLHFEIRLGDKAINPRRFLPPEMPN
ncbi:MAG: M23 family metallopeptidase [Pyrinomonadaceae bacterium]